jgi:hypothetical protein
MPRLLTEKRPDGSIRWLDMTPAFDKRDPDPKKNYGIHGAELHFGVSRGEVTVVLRWMTPFHLPEVRAYLNNHYLGRDRLFDGLGGIDYHASVPLYEGAYKQQNCMYTGGDCYGDRTATGAGELFDKAVADPEEIWKTLDSWLVDTEKKLADQKQDERWFS